MTADLDAQANALAKRDLACVGDPIEIVKCRWRTDGNGQSVFDHGNGCPANFRPAVAATYKRHLEEIAGLKAWKERVTLLAAKDEGDICQALGKALGYPWYKDDQANFPGATEADGVCVGEHVGASIAAEAAQRINALRKELEEAKGDRE